MPKDLEGLLVVTLEQAVAAPYASSRLADAGARVIKLEREEGDFARRYDRCVNGLSAYFVWLNRGKESVRFNLKDPEDQKLLHNLLSRADVFIQNLAPGATERAGFGTKSLRERYPQLITCDISGYGMDGPYRDMKAYDLLVQAETGLANITGTPDSGARVGVSVSDIAAGMYAQQAILQALFARERGKGGRSIEVSLYHSTSDWMNVPYLQHHYGKATPKREGLRHPTIAPYGVYGCRDGKSVLIAIQNEREWKSLCENVLERPDITEDPRFASNPERVTNRQALDEVITAVFSQLDREQAIAKLTGAKVAYGKLSTMEDVVTHPQNRFVRVETSAGEVNLLAPPPITPEFEESYGPVPELGADDTRVREEFSGS
ncbi:CaiB/BaiF CoA transferase family protein [Fodinicurvata halophila]|uniref:CaiB/BaiF CoA transferase family protein n=2 Tax=Fodinicurvata halophila TaxID=1419723 RepID=A0ABV8UPW5_9PROT